MWRKTNSIILRIQAAGSLSIGTSSFDFGTADFQRAAIGREPIAWRTPNVKWLKRRTFQYPAFCEILGRAFVQTSDTFGCVNRMLKSLGKAAREARREAGKRTMDVAVVVDRNPATIERFERGDSWPRDFDEFLDGYAQAIGVTVRELWIAALDNYVSNGNGSTS